MFAPTNADIIKKKLCLLRHKKVMIINFFYAPKLQIIYIFSFKYT